MKSLFFLVLTTTLTPPMLYAMENSEPSNHAVQSVVVEGQKSMPEPTQHDPEPIECSICWDEILSVQGPSVFSCIHIFHSECLNPWLKIQKTCPLCRVKSSVRWLPKKTLLRKFLGLVRATVLYRFSSHAELGPDAPAVPIVTVHDTLTPEDAQQPDFAPYHQQRRLAERVAMSLRIWALGHGVA